MRPDLRRQKRTPRRIVRVATGLYRYGSTGQLYWCRKVGGKNVWRSLNTTDQKKAFVLMALENLASGQNGNTEFVVVTTGGTGPVRFNAPAEPWSPPSPPSSNGPAVPAEPSRMAAIPQLNPTVAEQRVVTLRELANEAEAQTKHLSKSTLRIRAHYRTVLEENLDFRMNVAELTTARIRRLRSELSVGRKASTVNDLISKGLKPLLTVALESGVIGKSPLEAVKPLKKGGTIRLQPSWDEAVTIIDKVEKSAPESALLLRVMLYFGLGQAEIQGLCGEHVDINRNMLRLLRQKTRKPFEVPIFDHAKSLVQALKDDGKIVTGKPVFRWLNPRKALSTASRALGFPAYSPRALRRSFIVHCLEKGIDARLVAKWQGHRDAKLVLSVYGNFIGAEYEQQQVAKL